MALNTNKDLKLYYSIKEVAAMFDINESALRYWEKEFPELHPKTTQNRVRQYTKEDIEKIRTIHNLVKVRGHKISSAKKILRTNKSGADKSADILTMLINSRDELKNIKKQLDALV